MHNASVRSTPYLYALLAIVVIPIFPHFVSPNEMTRWATAASLVEHHTFEITPLLPLLGGNAFEDASEVDGHVYSNKAPGAALLGLPAYAVARLIAGPPSATTMRMTANAMRLLAATVPLLFLAWAMRKAAAQLGASPERIGLMVLALLFATPLFAYGLLNFSHVLTAAALFGAWTLLFVHRKDYAAGALIGLATVSEYPCAIAGLVLVACAWRRAPRVIAGGLPFAIALAVYNKLLFGSVFALSSANERNAQFRSMAREGLFGIGLPDPATLLHLLFDPSRGLFLFAPILLAAIVAMPRARRVLSSEGFVALAVVPIALIIFYSGYPNWHGGWSVGPRYLVPAIPFLLFPLAFAVSSVIEWIVLGASVAAVVPLTMTFPFPDRGFAAPWSTLALPLLRDGLVAPNLLHLIARPLAIAVPFAIVLTATVLTAKRNTLFVALGVILMFALGSLASPPTLTTRLRIGYIEEVYFEQPGAMSRAVGGLPLPPRAIARARNEAAMPPTSWPF
ncbi:MAG TPA: hypothetical protein VN380_25035 [Thermoanaerobaculia bacterium]|nr:hypothetical protein [Thermoanaerobaculia bacterium]